MARPKKPEERNRIRDVAFNVFTRKGFENTSFSDIAKEASVSKSLVQYYFPKKEKFVSDFINKSLTVVETMVTEDLDYEFKTPLGKLYAIGYAQFHFAMNNDKMNSLRMDVLRDRGNTELVVKHGLEWIIRNTEEIEIGNEEEEDAYKKTMVFVIGGAFDYLYDCILYGVDFDLDFLSDTAMLVLGEYTKGTENETDAIRAAMSPEWLEEERKRYNKELFFVKQKGD